MLIYILILVFIILIFYQLIESFIRYTSFNNSINVLESMTTQSSSSSSSEQYQPYDNNNPNNVLILAQQNAGNIQVLKQQMDSILGLKKEVEDISGNLITLTEQVTGLMQQKQTAAKAILPSSPPKITGIN
jgi:lipopolysaccharide export LptBFGC system permease protein LptF